MIPFVKETAMIRRNQALINDWCLEDYSTTEVAQGMLDLDIVRRKSTGPTVYDRDILVPKLMAVLRGDIHFNGNLTEEGIDLVDEYLEARGYGC